MTEIPIKLLMLGDSGVGKSSLLDRFCLDKKRQLTHTMPTVGIDFKIKRTVIDGNVIKIQVWDTVTFHLLYFVLCMFCLS